MNDVTPSKLSKVESVNPFPQGELQVSTLKWWTSLDLNTDEGRKLFMQAKSGDCFDFNSVNAKEIELHDILIHEVKEDGEPGDLPKVWCRNVLILAKGEMVAGGSQGVRDSIADLMICKGRPPWNPPLKVRLMSQTTASKRTRHYLELV